MTSTIADTKNYSQCIQYVNELEHFFIGAKLPQYKIDRINTDLRMFCSNRNYNNDSSAESCSSDNSLGDTTLNTMTKSPVDPSLVNPFPLMVFSSRF